MHIILNAYCIVLYCIVLYCIFVLYCIVLYCIVLYCTALPFCIVWKTSTMPHFLVCSPSTWAILIETLRWIPSWKYIKLFFHWHWLFRSLLFSYFYTKKQHPPLQRIEQNCKKHQGLAFSAILFQLVLSVSLAGGNIDFLVNDCYNNIEFLRQEKWVIINWYSTPKESINVQN